MTQWTPTPDDYQQGWDAASALVTSLASGGPLPEVPGSTMVLGPGERHHVSTHAATAAYYGRDVDYNTGWLLAGTWRGMLLTGAASWLYNSHQRKRAERESAVQWRAEGVLPVHLTSERLLVMANGQWETFYLESNFVAFEPWWDSFTAVIHPNTGSPFLFEGPSVPYLSVVLYQLLHRRVPELTALPPGS